MLDTDISFIINEATPRLIDEWQVTTKIWDAVRLEVGHRGKDGQFIFTGSALLSVKKLEKIVECPNY